MKNIVACLLGAFLILLPFYHYGQIKLACKDFTLLEANYENWSPGITQPNQPRQGGIIYRIKIVSKTKSITNIDSLIIGKNRYTIEILKGASRNYTSRISKGDTLAILCRRDINEQEKNTSKQIQKLIQKKGVEGFLYYKKSKQIRLLEIPSFAKYEPKSMNK